MKEASISELENQLSAHLQSVRAGKTVMVYERNRPVASIDRVADEDDDDRIVRLQRADLVAPPADPMPLEVLRSPAARREGLDVQTG